MDKANYGWKIRSNMTTCMPKLQQHLRRIKQGHAVNKKGKNRQKSHTLKNLLNLINMSKLRMVTQILVLVLISVTVTIIAILWMVIPTLCLRFLN